MGGPYYVYSWTRPDTGDIFYIGKGKGRRDVTLKKYNPHFMRVIEKLERLGIEPTVERICDNMSEEDAFDLEVSEIARLGRWNKGAGLLTNMSDGGDGSGGWIMTEEIRKNMIASRIGKPRSAQTREKIRVSMIGHPVSDETIAKIVASRRMHPPPPGRYRGITFVASRNRWQVYVGTHNDRKYIGNFKTEEAAAMAYDKAAISIFGQGKCHINIPEAVNDNLQLDLFDSSKKTSS